MHNTLFMQEDGNIEDDAEHGPEPFEVSGGSTMIEYLLTTLPAGSVGVKM